MDLAALRTHVYDLIGQDEATATDSVATARVDRWINRAAKHAAGLVKLHAPEEWTETGTFNTVAGQREYDLITNLSGFLDLHRVERSPADDTSHPTPVDVDRSFDRGYVGVPNRLYLRKHLLGFYRAPESIFALHVHYSSAIETLDATSEDFDDIAFQNPRLRDEFHDTILFRAAWLILGQENSDNIWKTEALEAEARMIQTLGRRRRGPRFINMNFSPRGGRVSHHGWRGGVV